jgi:hypothetical protein
VRLRFWGSNGPTSSETCGCLVVPYVIGASLVDGLATAFDDVVAILDEERVAFDRLAAAVGRL